MSDENYPSHLEKGERDTTIMFAIATHTLWWFFGKLYLQETQLCLGKASVTFLAKISVCQMWKTFLLLQGAILARVHDCQIFFN